MSCNNCNNGCNDCTCKSNTVIYEGATLDCIGVQAGDNLETILSKLEDFVCANTGGNAETCSDCVNYCGEDIVCDTTTIAANGDSLDTIITNIKDYLCTISGQQVCTTDVTYCGSTLECGEDILAVEGSTLDDIFASICTLIQNANQDIQALDEGSSLTTAMTSINFTGAGVTATNVGGAVTVDVPASAGGSDLEIQDEGSQLTTTATSINFTGAGVTATNVGGDVTVDIPSTPTLVSYYDEQTAIQYLTNSFTTLTGASYTVPVGQGGTYELFFNARVFSQKDVNILLEVFKNGSSAGFLDASTRWFGEDLPTPELTPEDIKSHGSLTTFASEFTLADGDLVEIRCQYFTGATDTGLPGYPNIAGVAQRVFKIKRIA